MSDDELLRTPSERIAKRKFYENLAHSSDSDEELFANNNAVSDEEPVNEVNKQYSSAWEEYFHLMKGAPKTSNNDMDSVYQWSAEELLEKIPTIKGNWNQPVEQLNQKYYEMFKEWNLQVRLGFNLLFYGYGSKRKLLLDFVQQMFNDTPIYIVNGFFPDISIREIMNNLFSSLETGMKAAQNVLESVDDLLNACSTLTVPLLILVHNIDGIGLRNDKTQLILSLLAKHENVRVIASIDHVNAALLWDRKKACNFSFLHHFTPTYYPYLIESSFDLDAGLRKNAKSSYSGIMHVLLSLTDKARGIYSELLQYQYDNLQKDESKPSFCELQHGMEYNSLFKACQDKFYATNLSMFQTLLKEFLDHDMIEIKRDSVGSEMVYAPISIDTMMSLLEQENEDDS